MLSALIPARLSYPAMHLAAQPVCQRSVRHGPLVLVSTPRKPPTPTIDRDRTVSRRSEPSSRATLMGEQPNPWDLSDGPSIRNRRITMLQFPACSARRPPSQAPFCHCTLRPVTNRPEGTFRSLRYSFGGDHPSQTTHQAVSPHSRVRNQTPKGPYFNGGSMTAGAAISLPPAYPTHRRPGSNAKL